MSDCCSPGAYRWLFSERRARREMRRYQRRGLDHTSRRVRRLADPYSVRGRTLLEIGGGIGAMQLEFLRAGAVTATSVELTPTYEDVAAALIHDAGLEDRVNRRVMDFAESAAQVSPADVVILNRVICCYPDMPRLTGAAAQHTRELLLLSFPRRAWWTQAVVGLANVSLRIMRRRFHIFVHPPKEIFATAAQHGLRPADVHRGVFWTVASLQRAA